MCENIPLYPWSQLENPPLQLVEDRREALALAQKGYNTWKEAGEFRKWPEPDVSYFMQIVLRNIESFCICGGVKGYQGFAKISRSKSTQDWIPTGMTVHRVKSKTITCREWNTFTNEYFTVLNGVSIHGPNQGLLIPIHEHFTTR